MKLKNTIRAFATLMMLVLFLSPTNAFASGLTMQNNSVPLWICAVLIVLVGTVISAIGFKGYGNKNKENDK